MLDFVVVDIFAGLLATDSKDLAEVPGGQPTFPQGDDLDKAISQQLFPAGCAHSADSLARTSPRSGLSIPRYCSADFARIVGRAR